MDEKRRELEKLAEILAAGQQASIDPNMERLTMMAGNLAVPPNYGADTQAFRSKINQWAGGLQRLGVPVPRLGEDTGNYRKLYDYMRAIQGGATGVEARNQQPIRPEVMQALINHLAKQMMAGTLRGNSR